MLMMLYEISDDPPANTPPESVLFLTVVESPTVRRAVKVLFVTVDEPYALTVAVATFPDIIDEP